MAYYSNGLLYTHMSLFSKGCRKLFTSPCISATWAFSESIISLSTTFLNACISEAALIGDVVTDPDASQKSNKNHEVLLLYKVSTITKKYIILVGFDVKL